MTATILHSGHGQHIVHLPRLVADLWRLLVFGLAIAVFASAWVFIRWPGLPASRHWFMAGVMVAAGRLVLVQVENWQTPITWEATPITTVVLLVWLYGFRVWLGELGRRPT